MLNALKKYVNWIFKNVICFFFLNIMIKCNNPFVKGCYNTYNT